MSPSLPISWPLIISRRDSLPRNMSYMIRTSQLSPCFGLKDRPESWLECAFSNTITSFSGPERAGRSFRRSTILRAYHDPDRTFDFHHLFINTRPWKEAADPLIVHAYIDAVPTPASRRCRDAVLTAVAWLATPYQISSLTPGKARAWKIELDIDPIIGTAVIRAFARPVRDLELLREVTFEPPSDAPEPP